MDVVVPGFEVGAAGAAAFAALVDSDELIVVEFEEGDHALAFAVSAFDVAAGAAHGGPGATEASGPFREEGVLSNAAKHDAFEAVVDFVEVAGGELAVGGAAVEECGGGGAEAAAFVEAVELNSPVFALLFFVEKEAHSNAHPEELWGLYAADRVDGFVDDEVAVVEGLDAEVVEVEVGGGIEGIGKNVEIVVEQPGVKALDADAVLQIGAESASVAVFDRCDTVAQNVPFKDFFVDVGEEDACSKFGEVGVLFCERFDVEDKGLLKIGGAHLFVEGTAQLGLDLLRVETEVEANVGEGNALAEVCTVPEGSASVGLT